jgi:predicted Zn-dependent protease
VNWSTGLSWLEDGNKAQVHSPCFPAARHSGPGRSQNRCFWLILLLVVLRVVPTCAVEVGTLPGGSNSAVERALQLEQVGESQEAETLLKSALVAHPADLDLRLALGDLYARTGQLEQAEQEFRHAVRQHPNRSSVELALGSFYNATGKFTAAEEILRALVRRNPHLLPARLELALAQARQHKYADAETNIRAVPAPAAPDAQVRYYRLVASIRSGLGDAVGAARAMERAVRAAPDDQQLRVGAAMAEAEAGDWTACIANLSPVYAKQPNPTAGLLLLRAQLATHSDITSTLSSLRALSLPEDQEMALRLRSAELLVDAGKHNEAAEELSAAVKLDGGRLDVRYNLAVEQFRAGQLDESLNAIAHLRAQEDSAEVEDLAGDIEEEKGDYLAAVHAYQSSVSLAPKEERYRLSLGAELIRHLNYDAALVVFRQAAQMFADSARVYIGLGITYHFLQKEDESVAAFLRADQLSGNSSQVIGYFGVSQLGNADGPSEVAVKAACARADASPNDPTSLSWCGTLLFRRASLAGNQSALPEILRRLQSATRFQPEDPIATCSLGSALAWGEKWQTARHWLETCIRLQPGLAEGHYRLSRVYKELGLEKEAHQQAELTQKAFAERDQREALLKKFTYEMLQESKSPPGSK